MEYYDHSFRDIDWAKYQELFTKETKSENINRSTQINMLQQLLHHGVVHKSVLIMNEFWKETVKREKWKGNWFNYRNHFKDVIAPKIESFEFLHVKFRALLLFVSSRSVQEECAKNPKTNSMTQK
ncbi:hypothetical protein GCK72_006500 [Caenorhabditis remanei]|uniref:SPK domain-containing protein n=1 Tax=Caenorhabditis remanei TaxID=31234 RepID=A0A6A5HJI3_CAERE|nr:hypothetical protein GCK72_006500 [Caenorhabditis remanei]KAF1766543.1 hypothetical protein GCK72_006500 [Caenorhabditis remanei]